MEILTWDELSPAERDSVGLMDWSDGDPPEYRTLLDGVRRFGPPFAPYTSLLAREEGEIVARVTVLRLPWREGPSPAVVAGIADVVTRPDRLGRGHARSLLANAAERERDAGLHLAFLWTRRSWGAHALYRELGYRDVYSPAIAMRRGSRASRVLPAGYRRRRASAKDLPALHRLVIAASRSRLGFLPRPAGALRLRQRLGWRRPEDHEMLFRRDRLVGFAHAPREPHGLRCREVVAPDPADHAAVLDLLERAAGPRTLALGQTTFVQDAEALLRERGYRLLPTSHSTLMAASLASRASELDRVESVCADPRFFCHSGDYF